MSHGCLPQNALLQTHFMDYHSINLTCDFPMVYYTTTHFKDFIFCVVKLSNEFADCNWYKAEIQHVLTVMEIRIL